ncbi:minor capsid protein E [Bacillus clarus]|uniref:Minor capsid protein E n=1 Tax=Bacillus clarus TaxID=2338372 RepID=A0A090YLX8_9BACI|nr:major capsid protein [Bacillus clarus]KFM99231.1 phage major capsid E family protein [Bacillus clarus]RFT67194.1 minor capsid protein E [Bacillus clarus]
MGIAHLEQFQPPLLKVTVEEVLHNTPPTFADKVLPNVDSFDTNFAFDVVKHSKHIAGLIGYGSEPPVMDKDQVASKIGEVVKIGIKNIYSEEELLALNTPRNPSERESAVGKMVAKNVDIIGALQLRIALMKLEAIMKGELRYNQNGVKLNVDYGISEENRIVLPSGNDWSNPEHDIIGDIEEWAYKYQDLNGEFPDLMVIPPEVTKFIRLNKGIRAEVARMKGGTSGIPLYASNENIQKIFEEFGLPKIEFLKRRSITARNLYTGEDEQIEYALSNRIVFVKERAGETIFGPTVENGFDPGYHLEIYDKQEPIESVQRGVVAALPVITKPSLLMFADVISNEAPVQ